MQVDNVDRDIFPNIGACIFLLCCPASKQPFSPSDTEVPHRKTGLATWCFVLITVCMCVYKYSYMLNNDTQSLLYISQNNKVWTNALPILNPFVVYGRRICSSILRKGTFYRTQQEPHCITLNSFQALNTTRNVNSPCSLCQVRCCWDE